MLIEDLLASDEYRYEKKSLITGLSRYEVESIIKCHPAMFTEVYPLRSVNNIYFDTPSMQHYFDNVDGLSNRLKVRVRWYGDILGKIEKPVLELKIKKNLVSCKKIFPLKSFILDSNFSLKEQQEIFLRSDIPDNLKEYLCQMNFSLLNHYNRKYFLSSDRKFRVTIDFDLQYYKLRKNGNSFLEKHTEDNSVVVEIKYSSEHEAFASSITDIFPYRITKNSKYVTGIDGFML